MANVSAHFFKAFDWILMPFEKRRNKLRIKYRVCTTDYTAVKSLELGIQDVGRYLSQYLSLSSLRL